MANQAIFRTFLKFRFPANDPSETPQSSFTLYAISITADRVSLLCAKRRGKFSRENTPEYQNAFTVMTI